MAYAKENNYQIVYNRETGKQTLRGYADASFPTKISLNRPPATPYGYVISYYGGPILWKVKRMKDMVPTSTAEAEILAVFACAEQIYILARLMEELGQWDKKKPVKIYSDNAAAVKGCNDERNVNFWKHKYLKIKEWQDEGYSEKDQRNRKPS